MDYEAWSFRQENGRGYRLSDGKKRAEWSRTQIEIMLRQIRKYLYTAQIVDSSMIITPDSRCKSDNFTLGLIFFRQGSHERVLLSRSSPSSMYEYTHWQDLHVFYEYIQCSYLVVTLTLHSCSAQCVDWSQ